MRVGLVCPYSLDVPGGVQNHVRDLAESLLARGHQVSVLAPSDDDDSVPDYVAPAGRAVPVPYNGSVARLTFGPLTAARVRRWIRDGRFDVLHIHEPATPSTSLLALWAAEGPIVATFHNAMPRSRAMSAASAILRPALEKVSARVAVSEYARDTLVQHLGGEPVVIPNGLWVDRFAGVPARPDWRDADATIAFLGRLDESRKGLPVLLDAAPRILATSPDARLLVAGRGDVDQARRRLGALPDDRHDRIRFLGMVDDATRAALLASADVYVAPNTGGESFGIILLEAMAAGATVLASDIPPFRRVLDGGRFGALFPVGDPEALADESLALLAEPERRRRLRTAAAAEVRRYDWSVVTDQVLDVYATVTAGRGPVAETA